MHSKRLVASLIALSAIAAACSGTTDDTAAEADGVTADEAATGDGGSSDDGGSDEDEAQTEEEATERTPLFAPTESTKPFDLSGGATRSEEGVTVVSGDPLEGLPPDLRQATEPWDTDWSRRTVGLDELQLGIPAVDPRDRIPPIDRPQFEPISEANWLADREPGALVQFNGETRFYPLSILTRHEIVNDRFGDIPVIVTFCPLCNTAIAFDARVDGVPSRFGVSGLLRNSDLVMWDGETTTLWQQITGEAIVGELAGTKLDLIPTSIVSFGDAAENFPDALSLSTETGFGTPYGSNSYVGYSSSSTPFLFSGELDERFAALSRVVGVTVDEENKAYPFERISDERVVNDEVAGVPIAVLWGGDTADALGGQTISENETIGTGIAFDRRVDDQLLTFTSIGDDRFTDDETGTTWSLLGLGIDGPLAGEQLTGVTHRNEFWFAWAAFFPDASVYGS